MCVLHVSGVVLLHGQDLLGCFWHLYQIDVIHHVQATGPRGDMEPGGVGCCVWTRACFCWWCFADVQLASFVETSDSEGEPLFDGAVQSVTLLLHPCLCVDGLEGGCGGSGFFGESETLLHCICCILALELNLHTFGYVGRVADADNAAGLFPCCCCCERAAAAIAGGDE